MVQPTTCDLSHRKIEVLAVSATLLNLCNRGGMKSSKMSKGRNVSKKVGNHWYRPISVLPVLSKLFEKILYHRVYSYLTEHNLIDKRQYGFRENHSTEQAITSIYDELLSNFDNKLITCSLFLDLSKAFDCCDHEIVLDKLYHYGIRGVSHKLFSNFLHNRMQCIKIGEFKSSYQKDILRGPSGKCYFAFAFPYLH